MGFIYKIVNPNNKIYIGQTKNVKQRISDYRCFRYRSKKSMIMDSIRKYGWNNHFFSVIEECDDNLLDEREIYYIAEIGTYAALHCDGMNLTKGGVGQRHSWKNDKERVEKAKKRIPPNLGKKMSDETKKIISQSVSIYNKKHGVRPSIECHKKAKEKQCIPVYCYDINGNFISEFSAISIAAKYFGVSRRCATDAANGLQKHCEGIIFRKKSDGFVEKLDVSNIKFLVRKNSLKTNNKTAPMLGAGNTA